MQLTRKGEDELAGSLKTGEEELLFFEDGRRSLEASYFPEDSDDSNSDSD